MEKYIRLFNSIQAKHFEGEPVSTEDFTSFLDAYYKFLWGHWGPLHKDGRTNITYSIPSDLYVAIGNRRKELLKMLQWFIDFKQIWPPYSPELSPVRKAIENLDVAMLKYLIINDPSACAEIAENGGRSSRAYYDILTEIMKGIDGLYSRNDYSRIFNWVISISIILLYYSKESYFSDVIHALVDSYVYVKRRGSATQVNVIRCLTMERKRIRAIIRKQTQCRFVCKELLQYQSDSNPTNNISIIYGGAYMARFLENFGLEDLYDNEDNMLGILNIAAEEGLVYNGYYPDIHVSHTFGDLELCLRLHSEGDNKPLVFQGFDTHCPGREIWKMKVIGDITPKGWDRQSRRCIVKNASDGSGLVVVDIVNSDVLPSYSEGEEITAQMIGFPLSIDYYEDEEEYHADSDNEDNGNKIYLADGLVIAAGYLKNHQIGNNHKADEAIDTDEKASEDAVCLIRGTVKRLYHGVIKFGDNEFSTFIRCIIGTSFGDLQLVHTIDQVPENRRKAILIGSVVVTSCVLSGDVAIFEYETGRILDEEHDYSLLKDVFLNGDPERLRFALAEDAVYYAGYNGTEYKGRDAIIDRLHTVQEKTKYKFFVHRAELTSVDDCTDKLPYEPGKRCLVIANDDPDNYVSIAFIEVNEEGLIKSIETSEDGGYHFRIDDYDERVEIDESKMLNMIKEAYHTGSFEKLFPFMTEDYEHLSFWVMEVIRGKEKAIGYYAQKGKAIAEGDNKPVGKLVEILSAPDKVRPNHVYTNGVRRIEDRSFLNRNDVNKKAILFNQTVKGSTVQTLAIPTFADNGMLKQLLITEPKLFSLKPLE